MGEQVVKNKIFRRQTKEQTAYCVNKLCEKRIIELIKSYL